MSTDCVAWADTDDGSHGHVVSPRIEGRPMNRHCGVGRACAGAPRLARQRMGGPLPVSLRGSGGRRLFFWRERARACLHTRVRHAHVRQACAAPTRGSAEGRLPA